MRLIGMLDSPYVHRSAIALAAMNLRFDHDRLPVFRDYAAFTDAAEAGPRFRAYPFEP